MRQGRWTGRGAFFVVSALVAAFVLITAAAAQQRNNQAQRQRGPEPVPGGFQNEAVDLNEGKSPGELFKSGCAVCHNSAAGLAKGRSDSQLVGFLRQHYTSGTQHAAALASFLAANGRGAPAATPARLNPGAPVDRPPAPVGQEATRPQDREPAAKRKPHEKQPPVAARPVHPAPPAAPAAPPAATTEAAAQAAAHAGDTPAASPPAPAPAVEEKPPAPEIPL